MSKLKFALVQSLRSQFLDDNDLDLQLNKLIENRNIFYRQHPRHKRLHLCLKQQEEDDNCGRHTYFQ